MRIRNNIIANYVGQSWSALMNLAFVPVYVAYLGIENYALIGIFAALQAWLALLDLGMSPTLSREMARYTGGALSATAIRDLLRSVELICFGIALAAIVAMLAGSHFIATRWLQTHLPGGDVRAALDVMGVVVAFRFLESIYRSALYGLERQVWFNAVNIAVTTARFGGAALIVAYIQPSIAAFFLWQLAVSVVAVTVLRAKLGRLLPPGNRPARFSRAAIADVRHFAAGMIGINLTALVLTQADKVVLSRVAPLTEFGYYTLAFTMCSLLVAITGPIVQGIYPTLVRTHANGDASAFAAAYHQAARLIAVVAASAAGVLVIFAPAVIRVWTGDAVLAQAAGPLLALLAAGTMCNSLMQVPYFGLLAVGETRFPLRANIVATVALIGLLIVLVPSYQGRGAAATWLAVNAGVLLISLPWLHRHHLRGLLRPWLLRDTGPALLAAAAVCLTSYVALSHVGFDRALWLALLPIIGALAAAAAAAAAPDLRGTLLRMTMHRDRARPAE